MPAPTKQEVAKFFSYYHGQHLSDHDFGILYFEEFADRFTEDEINNNVMVNAAEQACNEYDRGTLFEGKKGNLKNKISLLETITGKKVTLKESALVYPNQIIPAIKDVLLHKGLKLGDEIIERMKNSILNIQASGAFATRDTIEALVNEYQNIADKFSHKTHKQIKWIKQHKIG